MKSVGPCLFALLVAFGCSKKKGEEQERTVGEAPAHAEARASADDVPGEVRVSLTVDWEGAYLNEEGLEAMAELRKELGDAPLTHFVCPAYFTQSGAEPESAPAIKAQIAPGDEVGLHIHSWFSLAERAGVTPRREPNFFGDTSSLMEFESGDLGFEIPLSAYAPADIEKIVETSHALLEENGLGKARSFRAGGYAAGPEVLSAIAKAGMSVDSSATWPTWFEESRGDFQAGLRSQWPKMKEHTQPYRIDTPHGPIVEVPNTGAFVEYATSDEMLAHLESALSLSRKRGVPIYVDFGFHQETADEFLYIVGDALINFREAHPDALHFVTVSEAASSAKAKAKANHE